MEDGTTEEGIESLYERIVKNVAVGLSPIAICDLLLRHGHDISLIHPCDYTRVRVRAAHKEGVGELLPPTLLHTGDNWVEVELAQRSSRETPSMNK